MHRYESFWRSSQKTPTRKTCRAQTNNPTERLYKKVKTREFIQIGIAAELPRKRNLRGAQKLYRRQNDCAPRVLKQKLIDDKKRKDAEFLTGEGLQQSKDDIK